VLIVTRLNRLARSTSDLLNILDAIAKAGAGFRSLKDAWADTTTPHGKLMLTVLGGLAESERELIRARTDDGRKRAKARGVKFGRPVKLTAHQRQEAIQRMERQGLHQWSTRPDSMQQIHRRAQYFIILRIGRNWGLAFLIILIRSRL
jgi:DNA invertase Pin-like site-specific DNA recombinase